MNKLQQWTLDRNVKNNISCKTEYRLWGQTERVEIVPVQIFKRKLKYRDSEGNLKTINFDDIAELYFDGKSLRY